MEEKASLLLQKVRNTSIMKSNFYKSRSLLSHPQNASLHTLHPSSHLPSSHILHSSLSSYPQAETSLSAFVLEESSPSGFFSNLPVQSSLLQPSYADSLLMQPSNANSNTLSVQSSDSFLEESSNDPHFARYAHYTT